jgi:DNA mismatch repair protein PMS2
MDMAFRRRATRASPLSITPLSSLQTFGFRGEALSSLCALSSFYVITALADEAPRGKKLEFEPSGNLKSTSIVAAQKGTTAVVEGLFEQLPVRRKELAKNIKREYGKVLGLLHAYACISTNVKFTIKSTMAKGKTATVFATKGNPTTKENITNIYGAKTISALIALDLQLDFQSASTQRRDPSTKSTEMLVRGYISRPVFGEGRQTPDRQMFFVNGRPCGLPQIAKAFNEVYKFFNVLQSPFIFADLEMDTNAYDVNVSPDKRTIMLHDSATLVESLKSSLTDLFDQQDQTMPQSQVQTSRLPAYKQLTIARESTVDSTDRSLSEGTASAAEKLLIQDGEHHDDERVGNGKSLLQDFFRHQVSTREEPKPEQNNAAVSKNKKRLAKALEEEAQSARKCDEYDHVGEMRNLDDCTNAEPVVSAEEIKVRDFNRRLSEQQQLRAFIQPNDAILTPDHGSMVPGRASPSPPRPSAIQNAFDRVRPHRLEAEVATITVGDKTITTVIGSQVPGPKSTSKAPKSQNEKHTSSISPSTQAFTQKLRRFAASDAEDKEVNDASLWQAEPADEVEDVVATSNHSGSDNTPSVLSKEEDNGRTMEDDSGSIVEGDKPPISCPEGDYFEESEKRAQEIARVAELIRAAEEKATMLNVNNAKRANKVLKIGSHKDSTLRLQVTLATSMDEMKLRQTCTGKVSCELSREAAKDSVDEAGTEEDRLALTVSKADFSSMQIVGQFNLGFILAVRTLSTSNLQDAEARNMDELFIIDQHASDEKYNFERLQAETVVNSQRLVRPKQLDLTAVEEERLIENSLALEKNGFIVHVDSGEDEPIGRRCKLLSLPLSKEVAFGLEDLDELLHLLAESPGGSQSSIVPRPSKVRKMFAMRACRSSIMIGKTLTEGKMRTVVQHMGEIDKPWNCPHGRPTMRHLMTLNSFETWHEGDGLLETERAQADAAVWVKYA